MRIVDVNVLVYAINADAPNHDRARQWLDRALAGTETVGFAWIVLLAFLRLVTSSRIFEQPLTLDQAVGVIEGWLAAPAAATVDPIGGHLRILHRLLEEVGTAANHVSDAHLAALAIEHRATIVSFDADFARYPR